MKSFLRVWISISLIAIGVGLGLVIIATAFGARWKEASNFSMNETYEAVESLDMDINYGEVKIVKGNEFSISADNLPEDAFDSYVSEGTWYIKEDGDSSIELFDIELPVGHGFNWDDHYKPVITITIPDNFIAKNFKLHVGAGTIEADEINASDGEFTVGAGTLQINQLTIKNESSYKVATGKMVLQDVTVKDITVEGDIGNVEINGDVTGDNKIQCGIGHIGLELNGNKEDYSYDVSSGIGDVDIDGDSYHSISNKIINNSNADNNLILDCGIGNITVDFN